MPQDDAQAAIEASGPKKATGPRTKTSDWRDRFGVPEGVQRVFRKFPLVTYSPNSLPLRAPTARDRQVHTLYVWKSADGNDGELSFNPTCLKWQAYLAFSGIPFRSAASNNHASPTGMLPFLLPATPTTSQQSQQQQSSPTTSPAPIPIPANKLPSWTRQHAATTTSTTASTTTAANTDADADADTASARAETYLSLLSHPIRRAWLYALYLSPANFSAVAYPRYVAPCSAHPLVGASIASQLRSAARDELLKTTDGEGAAAGIGVEALVEAREAFAALATFLGEKEWFDFSSSLSEDGHGEGRPGLFDASVFAYTHLLLDEGMGWRDNELGEALREFPNLVRHRERVLSTYFV